MTVRQIFETAMACIDETSAAGAADLPQNAGYAARTVGIVAGLIGELYMFSEDFKPEAGARAMPALPGGFDDEVALDDVLCVTCLPYGLVCRLIADENPKLSAFWEQKYLASVKQAMTLPSVFESIGDVYG